VPTLNAASEPIKNAQEVKQNNMLQIHANKAMGNIGHLDNVHSDLVSRGIDPNKASQVVDKIKSYMKVAKSEQYSKAKQNLLKAMTAGYGGGHPTSATGGQVLQTESLEDGRKPSEDKMKYVLCDDCGNEQVYMKHQVKCRKCHQNFPLDKLKNLI
jgi:Zn finger protein HypA/HybF involved in hydrogenase expression